MAWLQAEDSLSGALPLAPRQCLAAGAGDAVPGLAIH